ncbi:AI-2E family transporter [Terriglobus roseus]|uniref:Predicted PurR-regulated permease PerM n=1 Tax=Terriglobus roseus TaxID=392734 RepID=A0A1H4KZV5_9BACT|nr:AI-2E family transporter [Terriglobus roseus]SEB64040.1 Predicted PurR-regulated permease PerM [Terriglobus roseus]
MTPANRDRQLSPQTNDNAALLLVTCGGVVLSLLLLKPLIGAITGALLLYAFTRRFYGWCLRRIPNATVTAALVVCLTTLSLVIPTVLALRTVGMRAIAAIEMIRQQIAVSGSPRLFERMSGGRLVLASLGGRDTLSRIAQQILGLTSNLAMSFLGGTVVVLTQSIIMLFLLYFLLRDGERALVRLHTYLPFRSSEFRFLTGRVTRSVHATVFGRLVIALVQSLLSWVLFGALHVPGSLLLANLTFVCALIPTFGAVLVWFPVMLWLLFLHAWTRALILLALGTLLVSTADNVLYPIVVGSRAQMHTAPMFLSILGGMWMFGISGIFLGPLLFTVTDALLAIMRHRDPVSPGG